VKQQEFFMNKKKWAIGLCAVIAIACGTLFAWRGYYGGGYGWGGGPGWGYGPGYGYGYGYPGYYGYGRYDAGAAAVGAAGSIISSAIVADSISKANQSPEQIQARADAKADAEDRRRQRQQDREDRKRREREDREARKRSRYNYDK
jgi:hypothetical protein